MTSLSDQMIDVIESEFFVTSDFTGLDKPDQRTLKALRAVPRDYFVPDYLKASAFDNGPLPIGHGQTISQPYIVALMTELLGTNSQQTLLEIGTGSGYQSAVLAQLCKKLYTVEIIPELAENAKQRFKALNYTNIETRTGNGYSGWPEHAPYDGIIVTAAASHIPDALINQLKAGGKLVIPVGLPHMHQELLLVQKDIKNRQSVLKILDVAFVPLVDQAEFTEP